MRISSNAFMAVVVPFALSTHLTRHWFAPEGIISHFILVVYLLLQLDHDSDWFFKASHRFFLTAVTVFTGWVALKVHTGNIHRDETVVFYVGLMMFVSWAWLHAARMGAIGPRPVERRTDFLQALNHFAFYLFAVNCALLWLFLVLRVIARDCIPYVGAHFSRDVLEVELYPYAAFGTFALYPWAYSLGYIPPPWREAETKEE